MITDAMRREVARKLLKMPYFSLEHVAYAIGYDGEDDDWDEVDVINRLADLIEPQPERTCKMVSAFDTDELDDIQDGISSSPEDTLAYKCKGCGFDFRYERGLYPNYCPNCGAKVLRG